MLTAESHLYAIIPRGRLRQRDRGRAHDISTTTAPRFLASRLSAGAAGRRRLLIGHRRPFAASSGGTPQPPAGSSGPSSDGSTMSSSTPLLGAEAGGEPPPPSWWWVERVVGGAGAQLGFAVPMVVTSMAYYGIPLVSVMFSGHLGDVHLAGATLGNSWATITGYALVRLEPLQPPPEQHERVPLLQPERKQQHHHLRQMNSASF